MENKNFSKRYLIVNEIFNAITHGIGFGTKHCRFSHSVSKRCKVRFSTIHIVSYAIYGSTMILLFLFSTLFHSLIFTKARKVFQVFDHDSIFLLIAGSYTPFCLLSIKGWLGWLLFALIWLIAIIGIVYKSITLHKVKQLSHFSTIVYIIMGWLCVIAFKPLVNSLGTIGTWLLALGGISYTIGAFFYSLKNVRFMHVVWHLFVMLGAILIYFSVLYYT
ncbi:hemolysin III family protein [Enterococcus cecorum]